jgi:hypothetical protein
LPAADGIQARRGPGSHSGRVAATAAPRINAEIKTAVPIARNRFNFMGKSLRARESMRSAGLYGRPDSSIRLEGKAQQR